MAVKYRLNVFSQFNNRRATGSINRVHLLCYAKFCFIYGNLVCFLCLFFTSFFPAR